MQHSFFVAALSFMAFTASSSLWAQDKPSIQSDLNHRDRDSIRERLADCRWNDSQCTSRELLNRLSQIQPSASGYFSELRNQLMDRCSKDDAVCNALILDKGLQSLKGNDEENVPPHSPLFCAVTPLGHWLPHKRSGVWIGEPSGAGYSTASECEEAIATQTGDAICSWNGRAHHVYSVKRGTKVAGDQFSGGGFTHLTGCKNALSVSKNNMVCTWTGNSYLPVSTRYDHFVTRAENTAFYGFEKLEDCQRAVNESTPDYICSWSGTKTLGYIVTRIRTNGVIASFALEFNRCIEAAKSFRR